IYLGDRGIKSILIDGWNSRVAITVTAISRVRDPSGRWNFYTDEDIEDGVIVFTGVSSFNLNPSGPIPNDFIEFVTCEESPQEQCQQPDSYEFRLLVGSVDDNAKSTQVSVVIVAQGLHLEDPKRPNVEIRD
ncbi:MAG TPA: DUF6258 family protein, partial [Blastocatellia bacterium]